MDQIVCPYQFLKYFFLKLQIKTQATALKIVKKINLGAVGSSFEKRYLATIEKWFSPIQYAKCVSMKKIWGRKD